jgi:hypothetical protein
MRGPSSGIIQFQPTGGSNNIGPGQSTSFTYTTFSSGSLCGVGSYLYSNAQNRPGYVVVTANNVTTRTMTVLYVLGTTVPAVDCSTILTMTGPAGPGMDLNIPTTFSTTGISLNNFGSYWSAGTTGGVIPTSSFIFQTAISGSGQYQAIATNGNTGGTGNAYTYFSNDYGTTFTQAGATSAPYTSVAISTTGQYIVASYYVPNIPIGGDLNMLFSSDWGTTWTLKNVGPAVIAYNARPLNQGVTISSTGQYIYFAVSTPGGFVSNTNFYRSAEYGVTFSYSDGFESIFRCNISTSATGQYVVVNGRYGSNYMISQPGVSAFPSIWGSVGSGGAGVGSVLGMSSTAQYSYSAGQGGNPVSTLYRAANFLVGPSTATTCTIPYVNDNSGFYSISVSETGQYVAAAGWNGVAGGLLYVFTSSDFGNTWSSRTVTIGNLSSASSIAVSNSGQYILAGGNSNYSVSIANPITPILNNTAGATGGVYYDSTSKNLYYSATKTFVIDNPVNPEKYLVHGCLEGPEAGVYYRGKGEITNDTHVIIELPYYVSSLAANFSVQVSSIFNGRINNYNVSEVIYNKFTVYGNNGKFYWMVYGTRQEIEVDPNKSDVVVKGEGPYLWI